jgi:hypothetical protein
MPQEEVKGPKETKLQYKDKIVLDRRYLSYNTPERVIIRVCFGLF